MAQKETKFISLEMVLGTDSEALNPETQGEFNVDRLGTIPFTSINQDEYLTIKNACVKQVPNGTGGMTPKVDDDKLMRLLLIEAVHKDGRSTFSFRNKELLAKLGVNTDEGAVKRLLKPGEVQKAAVKIQNASGFGPEAEKEDSDAIKNS